METTNLSKIKREKMLETIKNIKKNITDETTLDNLSMIENELTKKKYGLIWEEHEERVDQELETKIPVFEEIKEKEIFSNPRDKFNFLLEGDNLHSLYLLEKTHKEKIDVIYIDPPYNTGNNDFTYGDETLGKDDEYKHSKWLSFMQRRLKIAKKLLCNKGIIFISIDDNEYANLKILCDSIFGETNFIGVYLKQSKVGGGNDSKFIVKEHEYCLVYGKDIKNSYEMFISHTEEYLKRYKEEDENGKYFWDTFARPGLKHPIVYEIEAPDGTIIKNGWIHSKARFDEEYKTGKIKIVKNKKGEWSVFFKQYLNANGKKPRSMTMDFGGSIDGKKDLINVLNDDKIFSYPKSVDYIKTLISTISVKDPIILDFFAGSGTTCAVAHKMGRRYIGVEQMDYIQDITVERMKKVIDGEQGGISKDVNWQGGGNFVYCELLENANTLIYNIQSTTEDSILEVKNAIFSDERIIPYITRDELNKVESDFESLSFEEKKQALIALVDKNKLYVNYTDMNDQTFNVTEEDKRFTKSFYEEV